jgi:hypothetical protein
MVCPQYEHLMYIDAICISDQALNGSLLDFDISLSTLPTCDIYVTTLLQGLGNVVKRSNHTNGN